MIDKITKFISELTSSDEPKAVIHNQKQLAEAVLMYHVMAVDGVINEAEKQRICEVLTKHFAMTLDEVEQLVKRARKAENEAIDLYKFTSILKQSLSEEDRVSIIENLWEMVFADNVVHELEDNVVWRIAELLAVDSRDRMALKQKVWKRNAEQESGS